MNHMRICAGLLGALMLSGCTTASAHIPVTVHVAQKPVTGHLVGRMLMEGGPMGPDGQQPGKRPLRGTVTITAAGHQQAKIRVGSSGAFSAWLSPGKYQVSGCTPMIEGTGPGGQLEPACSSPTSVTVTARHAARVTITFFVP
jgi:hypothetical protein